ncbi:hypothetical protein D3C81_809110 [compost metagenome]
MKPGAKCEANANGRPIAAASCALNRLEPSSQTGTFRPAPGTARRRWPGRTSSKYACSSSTSCGKVSALSLARWRRSARAVAWSVPGARPRPRSMRPGYSEASVPNCSAITSGEWLGSITPPEPTRMVCVPLAT